MNLIERLKDNIIVLSECLHISCEDYLKMQNEIIELTFISKYHNLKIKDYMAANMERLNSKCGTNVDPLYISKRWNKLFSKTNRRKFNQATKQYVYKRDQLKCSYCGSSKNIEVHHVVPLAKHGSNSFFNLVCACEKCNRSISDNIVLPNNWWKLHPESLNSY